MDLNAKPDLACPRCGPLLNWQQQHNGVCLSCRSLLTKASNQDWKIETCDACRFMVVISRVGGRAGDCRFSPPMPAPDSSPVATVYPKVSWTTPACAQYQRGES
jgi:hypothetical protein